MSCHIQVWRTGAGQGMLHQSRRDGAFAPSRTFIRRSAIGTSRQVRRKRFGRGECPVRQFAGTSLPHPACEPYFSVSESRFACAASVSSERSGNPRCRHSV